jgi:DNA-binding NtrC family response regulator
MSDRPQRSTILLVEDEPLLAMDVERLLGEVGFHVMGPVTTISRAIRSIEAERPSLTVVDLNLGGEMVFPLLDILADRAIPFVIVTGHSIEMVPSRHRHRPFLQKPYEPAALLRFVHQILSGGGDRQLLQRA